MASLFQKTGSPYYWVRFSHGGKRYQESTKQKNYNAAEKVMRSRVAEVAGSGSYNDLFDRLLTSIDQLPLREQESVRKALSKRLMTGPVSILLLSDAFDLFSRKPHERNPSKSTMKSYSGLWLAFMDWLKIKYPDIEYMHEISPVIAEDFLHNHIWGSGVTERTYNGYLLLLKTVFTKLATDGGLSENPFKDIKKMDELTESREPLSSEQLKTIIGKAEGEMRTMLLIGLYTGLRLKDVALLKWESVDLDQQIIKVIPSKTKKSNNSKKSEVVIPIHSVLHHALVEAKQDNAGVYVLSKTATEYLRYSPGLSFAVKKLFTDSGIDVNSVREDGRGRKTCVYSFHSLRHSFVSLCHASGVPQSAVMSMVGHKTEAVHMIYQHTDDPQRQKAIASLPNITGGIE